MSPMATPITRSAAGSPSPPQGAERAGVRWGESRAAFTRRAFLAATAFTTALPADAQTPSGVVTVAVVGEPGPLDPMPVTADLLANSSQRRVGEKSRALRNIVSMSTGCS